MDWNDVHRSGGKDQVRDAFVREWERYRERPDDDEPRLVRTSAPEPLPDDVDWRARLRASTNNLKRSTLLGVELVLANDERWRGVLAFDLFADRLVKREPPPWRGSEAGEWSDHDSYRAVSWFGANFGFEPSEAQLAGALSNVGRSSPFHPVRDWLDGLPYRNSSLLDVWLREAFGAADDPEYLALVGRKFLIGAVARVQEPGCKMDTVLILEGAQGLRKSSGLLELFKPWSSDAPIVFGDKDTYLQIHGTWLLELAELDSWNKAETSLSKAFFSQRTDRYRPPYGHRMVDVPRQTVFAGTTNQMEYLKDATGNRRYWPVRCGTEICLDWVRECKADLWAEALRAYRAGASWWVESDAERELVDDVRDSRVQEDPWEAAIARYVQRSPDARWSTDTLLVDAVKLDMGHIQKQHQTRLAYICRDLGLLKDRWHEGTNVRVRGYRKPD